MGTSIWQLSLESLSLQIGMCEMRGVWIVRARVCNGGERESGWLSSRGGGMSSTLLLDANYVY